MSVKNRNEEKYVEMVGDKTVQYMMVARYVPAAPATPLFPPRPRPSLLIFLHLLARLGQTTT